MKHTFKSAFIATLPVLTGYLVLGFGFGIILRANGYGILLAFAMSLFICAGSFAGFNSEGIDSALTALFITVFIEQWLTNKRHSPAIIGVVVSVVCLLLFGKDNFLIPSMLMMLLLLCIYKERPKHE